MAPEETGPTEGEHEIELGEVSTNLIKLKNIFFIGAYLAINSLQLDSNIFRHII